MKKLIAVSAVAALAATALSAEITFGSWGRGLWVTAANSGYEETKDGRTSWTNSVVTDIHQSWGGAAPRTALGVAGNSDNVGFALDIHGNGTGLGMGDNGHIWVKPIDQVKVYMGKLDVNVLRGDGVFGLWNWDRIGCVDGQEGWTFADYLDANGAGMSAVINPAEGLTIGVAVPMGLAHWEHGTEQPAKNKDGDKEYYQIGSLQDAWLNSAFVFAYDVQDVGTVKAALKLHSGIIDETDYNGASLIKDKDGEHVDYGSSLIKWNKHYATNKDGEPVKTWCEIAAAFDLKAVENLYASLGVVVPTLNSKPYVANAYARYNVNDQLAVHALVGTKINAYDDKKSTDDKEWKTGFGFTGGVGVDYALDGGLGLFADVRYANNIWKSGTSADNKDNLTIGAGVTKGFSNGVIGVAFEGTTNGMGRYAYETEKDKSSKQFAWEIPVKFEYWF